MTNIQIPEGLSYFATDGNYGDATGMVFVQTDALSEQEWRYVSEECSESERGAVAQILANPYEPRCDTCGGPFEHVSDERGWCGVCGSCLDHCERNYDCVREEYT